MEPVEDLHPSHMGGITGIVNSLSNKETYHRYAKAFITILKYSPMAVQRFCQGDAQVLTLQPHPIEEHPNGKQFNVTTEHEFNRLHRLCSDLHRAETWNGRHLQLYIYRCRSSVRFLHGMRGSPGKRMATEKKNYFVPAKRPWR